MSRNILIVTGSPRRHGNSSRMADAFTEGAINAGHTVSRFDAGLAKLSGCRVCDTCWSKGKPCSFEDDFNGKFVPLFEQADTLILCMPLYFYGFPAGIQAVLEKMYSYLGENSPVRISVKSAGLLMCSGETGIKIFDGAEETFRLLCKGMNWRNLGSLLFGGLLAKDDITRTSYLEKSKHFGMTIV